MFKPEKRLHRRLPLGRSVLAAMAAVVVLLGTATAVNAESNSATTTRSSASTQAAGGVTELPISFRVENVNRSKVPCVSDGKTYTVRGHLVGPAKALRSHTVNATTLYLHGLSFGEFFWNFKQSEGYDYATNLANVGQVSVIIDRLGYGSSDKPDGNGICVGSRADIAHQIVMDLRSGSYEVNPTGHGPQFANVILAGHSYGGQIAQVEAYSFGDIDGLVVISYADRVQSTLLMQNAAYAASVCATGGLRVNATGPAGYAPFGPPEGAPAALFHSAQPQVESAALQLLTIDPCGDTASFAKAVEVDLANLASIKIPVLVVSGGSDALFPPPAGPDQATLFTGSRSVNQATLPNTAHAVTLERIHTASGLQQLNRWLRQYFATAEGRD